METSKTTFIKTDRKFSDSEQKYVKAVVLYGHTDNYLYADEAHTEANKIDHDALLDLCLKGMVVVKTADAFYNPISFKEDSGAVAVTVATNVDASGSASSVYYSKEHSGD